MLVKYKPAKNFRGWPFVNWQSELMFRDYRRLLLRCGNPADPTDDFTIPETPCTTGASTQLVYGFEPSGWPGSDTSTRPDPERTTTMTGAPVSRRRPVPRRPPPFSALIVHAVRVLALRLQGNYDRAQDPSTARFRSGSASSSCSASTPCTPVKVQHASHQDPGPGARRQPMPPGQTQLNVCATIPDLGTWSRRSAGHVTVTTS